MMQREEQCLMLPGQGPVEAAPHAYSVHPVSTVAGNILAWIAGTSVPLVWDLLVVVPWCHGQFQHGVKVVLQVQLQKALVLGFSQVMF
ncbi:hypothetical protein MRX96_021208 [Rhipicephalus microplus]